MDYAFAYIVANGGIHKEEDYPYLMEEGTCEMKKVCTKPLNLGPLTVFAEAHFRNLSIGPVVEKDCSFFSVKVGKKNKKQSNTDMNRLQFA